MDAPAALHPTDQTLGSYGLGKLDEAAAGAIHRHLEACADCRRRVAELSSDSFLARLRDARGSATGSNPGAGREPPPAPPPAGTLPPDLADHPDYQILRELGRGGMGVVYLAHNRLMGRDEVLKVVSKHLLDRSGVLDRFLREIRSAARLHHPNIVTAYSAFRIGAGIVFAMEYVEGLDLAKMVKARGPLPVANACAYVQQVALGLQAAHEQGMVHRDIKPGNLMLARKGERAIIKVLDFGLAKATREDPLDGGLTHQGQMLGTPDYIAPEQITDAQSADIRADIYSLGCTAYYLLSGGPPFRGASLYDLLQAHHSMDAKPLNLARTDVPVELAALVAKMMAKEPHRRFQSPDEVAKALTPFFKAGKFAPGSARPKPGQASSSQAVTETSRAISTPTQPATPPIPTAASEPEAPRPEAMWSSLVDVKEPERAKESKPDPTQPSPRRPLWRRPAVVAGALLVGLGLTWAALVIKVKTPDGVIVLEDVPEQAEVLVDGEKVTVHSPEGGGPMEIRVPADRHKLRVQKDGFSAFGEEVSIAAGRSAAIRVTLVSEPSKLPADPANSDGRTMPAAPPRGGPWIPLFNGKDLSGWRVEGPSGDEWKVADGILRGQVAGRGQSQLRTNRQTFANFRLRVTYNTKDSHFTSAMVRHSQFQSKNNENCHRGYMILSKGGVLEMNGYNTKYAFPRPPEVQHVVPTRADAWHVLEVEALENKITTSLNGERVTEYRDDHGWYPAGDIVLSCDWRKSNQIKEVSLQELPEAGTGGTSTSAAGSTAPATAGGTGGSPPIAVDRPAQALVGEPPVPPAAVPSGSVDISKEQGRGGFASLFNGKDLTGWVADRNDGSAWAVEGNAIVARGETAKSRDYLLSTREFADFILRLEFSLEPGSTSGVPLRAATDDNILLRDGVHHGDHPMVKLVDVGAKSREKTGTTFWMRNGGYHQPDRSAVMKSSASWNAMEVEVRGDTMSASINGLAILHLTADPTVKVTGGTLPGLNRLKGRIGLEKHTGTVRFRNIEIKEIAPERNR